MYYDPVCGVEVDPEETLWWASFRGETYYFCSLACCERFEKEPERFIVAAGDTLDRESDTACLEGLSGESQR